MVIAANNAVLYAGKLSSAADVSVCRKKIAAGMTGALISGAVWAVAKASVKNAIGEETIL